MTKGIEDLGPLILPLFSFPPFPSVSVRWWREADCRAGRSGVVVGGIRLGGLCLHTPSPPPMCINLCPNASRAGQI